MTKALFLDRDGVLNRELGRYVVSVEEFELLPTVVEALQLASDKGYLLIIISNQGGVAKGLYGMDEVLAMQRIIENSLLSADVRFAEGYYCPHHPDHGKCLCRKPQPLLLQKAIARFGIDPRLSHFIGDHQRDMDAASASGVNGILLPSNGDLLPIVKRLP